jgi:hypothetical protein
MERGVRVKLRFCPRYLALFICLLGIVALFVSGCGKTVNNPALSPSGGGSLVKPTTTFSSARLCHSSAAFDSKLWVIAGGSANGVEDDVWYSSDGTSWTQATAGAAFGKRIYHSSVAFNPGSGSKMWVIGGYTASEYKNDVWYSSDGSTWTCATANAGFTPRRGHSSVVFDGKMWVIGGYDSNGWKNDVWYSSDGVTWTRATANANFSARFGHSSVVFDPGSGEKMWVIGGSTGTFKNDVWYSSDGVTWTQATASADFSSRRSHASAVFNSKMWVMGGWDGGYDKEIWSSSDGISWSNVSDSFSYFSPRQGQTAVALGSSLYVIGGRDSNACRDDVWATSDGTNWTRKTAVKLCFIHHSCGRNWLWATGDYPGLLGDALNDNNYYVNETYYGWNAEPGDGLGDSTDTSDWPSWFNDTKMPYVYDNTYHQAYNNVISDPGGENDIIMFKSCYYENCEVGGSIDDEKAIYNGLLDYFQDHPDKLFILITPPGDRSVSSYTKTKELCDWLVDEDSGWLKDYPYKNVAVYDFYCTLSETDSHHRIVNGAIQHEYAAGYDGASPYHDGDDHPNAAGNLKATAEFVPLLNYYYSRWKAETL